MTRISLNASTGRLALVLADVGHALEELGLDEELALAVDLLEQLDRLVEVAVAALAVEVAAEQEVAARPCTLASDRIVERARIVGADLLEDAGGLGQHARQRGEPLQGGAVVGVRVAGLDDLVEVGERAGVEPHLVERLAHEELGALLVLRVVAGLAVEDLLELDRGREVVLLVVELDRALERLRRRRRRRALGLELHVLAGLAAFFWARRVADGSAKARPRAAS